MARASIDWSRAQRRLMTTRQGVKAQSDTVHQAAELMAQQLQQFANKESGRMAEFIGQVRVVKQSDYFTTFEVGDRQALGKPTPGSGSNKHFIRDFLAGYRRRRKAARQAKKQEPAASRQRPQRTAQARPQARLTSQDRRTVHQMRMENAGRGMAEQRRHTASTKRLGERVMKAHSLEPSGHTSMKTYQAALRGEHPAAIKHRFGSLIHDAQQQKGRSTYHQARKIRGIQQQAALAHRSEAKRIGNVLAVHQKLVGLQRSLARNRSVSKNLRSQIPEGLYHYFGKNTTAISLMNELNQLRNEHLREANNAWPTRRGRKPKNG